METDTLELWPSPNIDVILNHVMIVVANEIAPLEVLGR